MSTLISPAPVLDINPFVGPRSLLLGEPIYGRDREIRRLVNLLIAERIVLLYSPSGAGKTSLISAGLIPRLRERRFQVSPVIRVSLRPPAPIANANRYLLSTLQSLEAGLRPDSQRSPSELLELGLNGYLEEWGEQDDFGSGNELLIFDQFEEALVLDPGDDAVKREFFHELGEALEERGRWALFSMREDHIAGLDPYVSQLPTHLHTRMRIDLLSPDSARRAAERLASSGGRPFQETAVVSLIESLRRVQAQRDGQLVYVPGPVLEPLQLQVVCRRLWESLPPDAQEITAADVDRLGRVQDALGAYYAQATADVAAQSGVQERILRDWFSDQLVTDQGVRQQQQRGPGSDPAAAERAVRLLEDAHLIRSEERGGTRWLELAHDQLVEPIQQNNDDWRRDHLSMLQQRALEWVRRDRPRDLLLTGASLGEAQTWAAANQAALTEPDHQFLQASAAAGADRRRRRRNTIILRWLAGCLAIALVAAGIGLYSAVRARHEAELRSEEALSRALAAKAATWVPIDPGQAVDFAEQALARAPTQEAEDVLRQALSQNPPTAVLPHGDTVNSVAFSPDGDRVVTASWDRTVRIWDTSNGSQLQLFDQPSNVIDARFSPDGNSVLTLTDSGSLSLWRADGPEKAVWRVDGVTSPVTFTHSGNRVLTSRVADDQVQVPVLDASTGTEVLVLAGHAGGVNSIALSSDDSLVLTAGQDGTARIWDGATGQQRAELGGHQGGVLNAAFRSDDAAIATGDQEGTVRIWPWPAPGDPVVVKGQDHGGAWVAFDPAGPVLAYGDKSPRLFDSSTGRLIAELAGHRDWLMTVAFSGRGGRAVTASLDGTARVWDTVNGRELTVLRSQGTLLGATMNAAGDQVATISGGSVRLFGVPAQTLLGGHDDWVLDAEVFPDGKTAAAGGQDGRVLIWDIPTGNVISTLTGPASAVDAIDVDPTGRYLAAATDDGSVRVWDVTSGQVKSTRQMNTTSGNVSFDHSGTRLVVAGDGVQVWAWQTPADPSWLQYSTSYSAVFSPDDRFVAMTTGDAVTIRDVAGYGTDRPLWGHTGLVRSVAYSKDGRYLVTAAEDSTAKVRRVSDGVVISTLEGHRGAVPSAAFDDSGKLVVTGGDDQYIGVWDAGTGRNLAMMPGHGDVVNDVQFVGGDHPRILSASDDSTVRLSDCEACGSRDDVHSRAARLSAADGRTHLPRPRVGQCFTYLVRYRSPVDCDEPHFAEIFAVVTPPAPENAPRPGDADHWAQAQCEGRAYQEYRGKASDRDDDYDPVAYGPQTSAEWALGQHAFACVLVPADGATTRGSARAPG
jgi:WD40 repeat protein